MKTKTLQKRSALPWFVIQWHITARCDQRCRHCYMVNNRQLYKREIENELPLSTCKKIIDSLIEFCKTAEARPIIYFTGGDPLLRPDFFEILEYASLRGIALKVMGNPFHLNPEKIRMLKRPGVKSYQVSIDGREELHDWFRKPGSFRATVEAIKVLKESGMKTVVMFTLSKKNACDLLDVMSIVSDLRVDVFSFARLTRATGDNNFEDDFSPLEYRELLLKVQGHMGYLTQQGSQTVFDKKDHLWKLLLYEQGKFKPGPNLRQQVISGCHVGRSNLTVLADGTVFACRRFYSPIGKFPEQSVFDVFVSDELNFYRNFERFEKCSDCPLFYHCRGCPAVAYGASGGNFYAPDPQCWRGLTKNTS